MRVGLDVLRRFVDLPADPHQVRVLLDECGLEVKRVERDAVDTCFTLELLANRGDHHCYEGLARELHARTGAPFRPLAPPPLPIGESPVPLRVETDLCLVYTAVQFEGGGGTLGAADLRTLGASGLEPISAAVDATNLVNLDLGQPTHAFDADAVEGGITIRLSRPGERAWPLFAPEPVEVPPGTVVIADDRKVLGIAGVIGCEESKATEATRRLLLESATFDPVAVRKASRALRIGTDASARFERGGDPARPAVGAARVAELLAGTGAWKRIGPLGRAGDWCDPQRVIELDPARARTFLGLELSDEDQVARLSRFGFAAKKKGRSFAVQVPPWRLWDVSMAADLHEELAKSVGYEAIPASLPPIDRGALPSADEIRRARLEEVLLGQGFYEVFTDGFYGRNVFAQLGIAEGEPLWAHVETTNALERSYALLKNNTLHQAIEAYATNERRRTTDVKLFEFTRTFHPHADRSTRPIERHHPPCDERPVLWLLVAGRDREKGWQDTARPADVWYLRGVLAEIGVQLGLDLQIGEATEHPLARFLHPGRRGIVTVNGEVAGVIGEVHPAVARRYKLKSGRPCFVELEWAKVSVPGVRPRFEEPPQTQALVRSLSFALPNPTTAEEVAAVLRGAAPPWLARVTPVDVFVPPVAAGEVRVRSVTYELLFANPEANRTADEVNAAVEALIGAVHAQLGSRGVRQR